MTIEATLCTIIRDDRILLQRKAEGRFGEGKWNGAGGKLQPGETPEECTRREVYEETGLHVNTLRHHGTLRHYFGTKPEPDWTVHQYSTDDFHGEPRPSEEGVLRWFPLEEIPYKDMWEDDEHWLPLLLEGKNFEGEFHFNEDATRLLRHTLKTVE
jgi:8-oxo-dGTP diphosphatase